ncbi:MAG: murein biosynthesis integral membrane protein MurJ [Gammaproteobacteria bacterium CG22_combo_CG10-13_8_21_14_all_40_8]|nr:MAG: murein biosynthesis integral membrane protein MurJ [Gammaproteobacteria bacterium CG22_combo_CG10-13_8_21_14_all_40_8]
MSKNLLKSTSIVSAMTFLSRILGLIRDVVLADFVGAGLYADVFLLAQKIPNFFRRLFAEGAFSQAFVPVLNQTMVEQGNEGVRQLINKVAGTLGLILLTITVFGVLGSTGIASLFGMGFIGDPEKFNLLSLMIKITLPYLMFISLTAFLGAVLNSYGKFAVPAITPIFLNLSFIFSVIFVAPLLDLPVMALPWAVFVAGVIQFGFQLPFLRKMGLLSKPFGMWKEWAWKDSQVQRILKLLTPALFGVSVVQINLLIDSIIATHLETGSISWLYYSDRLLEFPLGIFGIAIATVVLPSLSRKHAQDSPKAFSDMLDWAMKLVLLIGLPAAIALILLAEPLMLTLFQRGAFHLSDASRAAMSLAAYAIGLNFFMLIKVLAPGYYARQDTKTPVKIGLICVGINLAFNLLLYKPLGHVGLALATSLSAAVNALLLYRGLAKQGVYQNHHHWLKWSLQVLAALTLLVVVILGLSPEILDWQQMQFSNRLLWLMILVVAGVFCYVSGLLITGVRFKDLLHRE